MAENRESLKGRNTTVINQLAILAKEARMLMSNTVRVGVVMGVVGLLIGAVGCGAPKTADGAGKARLGVFNTRVVALAYGRSEGHNAEVRAKMAEYKRAKEAGDEERTAELEKWGEEGQARMHRQVFGDAPIPDILAKMADDLPRVAESASVDAIVGEVHHAGPGVELVDVTDRMAEVWNPDEETRKIMRELPKHPPVSEQELEGCCEP